jgi:hypothetical protein
MNNREAFEAWMKDKNPFHSLDKFPNGSYKVETVHAANEGYQAALASQAQQPKNHEAKIRAWCNTLEKAADNFERQGYSGESADLLDIKAYIQPLPPAPEGGDK